MSTDSIHNATETASDAAGKVVKSEAEWRAQLSPLEFEVTRRAATERAFTGRYWDHHEPGIYTCTCCETPLFESDAKFDSGCGWPSYFRPLNPEHVTERVDRSHGMLRTEILCARCDAHLGHVFEDGPLPTRLRYCINSASLRFDPSRHAPPPGDGAIHTASKGQDCSTVEVLHVTSTA